MLKKEELLKEWLKFKKAEEKAKKSRILIEKDLQEVYGLDFKEKSKTFQEEDLGFSISIKKNEVYKVDQEMWKSNRVEIPQHLRPEKISFSLDLKGYEYLKINEPEIYKIVSECVEFKANKPTIKVEKIK